MHKHISSVQNSQIKYVIKLSSTARERKKTGLFIIEGLREITLALTGNYEIETLFYCSEILNIEDRESLSEKLSATTQWIEVTSEVYGKIAYRATTEGIVAIAKTKELSLNALKISAKNPLILVAEAPEKPGNIGALLRTADAANVDAFIIANPKTDVFNANIIRSSVGCVFTIPIATGTTEEVIAFLKENNIAFYSAILQESVSYHTCDYTPPSAIVVGTEATGLSDIWRKESTKNISIPMQGAIDSMNVSVAAGIVIFEAKRQRGF
ncbi:TrmH family RNA methyltransferase [Patiriisocius marinus]|uniref:rRNA methyltransferase n=1 Tax=Patiriisocius marinus TaxID=1397112 RepID=A0A5J4IZB3_9FLAO|nr:RNA methyltransferase [Patiriisocius marinus]GER58978.1 rRNA methyltransferase [Patiriisocius marinus]